MPEPTMSSHTPRALTTGDVAEFLHRNGPRYEELLGKVRAILEEVASSRFGRRNIYRMYSRGAVQQSETKDAWKIREAVNRERQTEPSFVINDVSDVIGFTVVCIYPQSIESFVRALDQNPAMIVRSSKVMQQRGYRADHLDVTVPGGEFDDIRCEIQVKTILHDAWSRWTHDLTYKPRAPVHGQAHVSLEFLSELFTVCDKYSELIKEEIEKAWRYVLERRDAFREAYLPFFAAVGDATTPEFEAFRDAVHAAQDSNSDPLPRLQATMDDLLRAGAYRLACRLASILALTISQEDAHEPLLAHFGRWIGTAKDKELLEAWHVYSVLLWLLRRTPEALDAAEQCLQRAEELQLADNVRMARLNRLHFLADLGEDPKGERAAVAQREIAALMSEREMEAREKDTLAYAMVVFGQSWQEVEEGLALSKEALDESPAEQQTVIKVSHEIALAIAHGRRDSLLGT